jgi:hypothetical protein
MTAALGKWRALGKLRLPGFWRWLAKKLFDGWHGQKA